MQTNYGIKEALSTPYQRAAQVWDDRLGSARRQAYSWRIAAFAALGLAGVMSAGLIYQSSKASVIPYVVEVDEVGKVRLVGSPTTQQWEPEESVKRYFLEQWLRRVRGLSSDREVVRKNWLSAYNAVTPTAKAQLDSFAQEYKPFERLGEETRQIEVESINKTSAQSYRVEWREDVFEKSGYLGRSESYVGIVKLTHQVPADVEALHRNPLGLYVEHVSWSKDHQGGAQ